MSSSSPPPSTSLSPSPSTDVSAPVSSSSSSSTSLVDRAQAFMKTNSVSRAKLQGALKKLSIVNSLGGESNSRRNSLPTTEESNNPQHSSSSHLSSVLESNNSSAPFAGRLSDASDWDPPSELVNNYNYRDDEFDNDNDNDHENDHEHHDGEGDSSSVKDSEGEVEKEKSDTVSKYMAKTASKFAFSPDSSSSLQSPPPHSHPPPPSKSLPAYMMATASSKKKVLGPSAGLPQSSASSTQGAATTPSATALLTPSSSSSSSSSSHIDSLSKSMDISRRVSVGKPSSSLSSNNSSGRLSVGGAPPTPSSSLAHPSPSPSPSSSSSSSVPFPSSSPSSVLAPSTPLSGRPLLRPKLLAKGKDASKYQTLPSNFNPNALKSAMAKEQNDSITTGAAKHSRGESASHLSTPSLTVPPTSTTTSSSSSSSSSSSNPLSSPPNSNVRRSHGLPSTSSSSSSSSSSASLSTPTSSRSLQIETNSLHLHRSNSNSNGNGNSTPTIDENDPNDHFANNSLRPTGSPPPMFRARSSSVSTDGTKIPPHGRPSLSHGNTNEKFQHVNSLLAAAYQTVSERENDLRLAAQIGSMIMEENQKLETICNELSQKIEIQQKEHKEFSAQHDKLQQQFQELSSQNLQLIHSSLSAEEKSSLSSSTASVQLNNSNSQDEQFSLQEFLRVELGQDATSDMVKDINKFQSKIARERRQHVLQTRTIQDALEREERRGKDFTKQIDILHGEKSQLLQTIDTLKTNQNDFTEKTSQREFELQQKRQLEQQATNRQFQSLIKDLEIQLEDERAERQREMEVTSELQQTVQNLKNKILQFQQIDVPPSPGVVGSGRVMNNNNSYGTSSANNIQYHHQQSSQGKPRANSITSTSLSSQSIPLSPSASSDPRSPSPLPYTEEVNESPSSSSSPPRDSEVASVAADNGGVEGMMSEIMKKKGKRLENSLLDDEVKTPYEPSNSHEDPSSPSSSPSASPPQNLIDQSVLIHYIPESDSSSSVGPLMSVGSKKKKPNVLGNLLESLQESRNLISNIQSENAENQNSAVLEFGNSHSEREANRLELLNKIAEKKKSAIAFEEYIRQQQEDEEKETALAVEILLKKKEENEAKLRSKQAKLLLEKKRMRELEEQKKKNLLAMEELKASEARTADDYVALLRVSTEEIENLKGKISQLEEEIRSKEVELSTQRNVLIATQQSLRDSNLQNDNFTKEIHSKEQMITSLQMDISTHVANIAAKEKKYFELKSQKEESEGKLQELHQSHSDVNDKNQQIANSYQISLNKIQKLEENIRDLEEQKENSKAKEGILTEQIANLQNEKKINEENISQITIQLRDKTNSLEEIHAKCQSLEKEILNLQTLLRSSQESLSSKEKSFTLLSGEKNHLQSTHDALVSSNENLQKEFSELKIHLDQITKQMEEKKVQIQQYEEQIQKTKEENAHLQNRVSELLLSVSTAESEMNLTVKENEILIKKEAAAQQQINENHTENEAKMSEINKKLQEKTASLAASQTHLEDIQNQLSIQKQQNDEMKSHQIAVEKNLSQMETNLIAITEDHKQRGEQMDQINQKLLGTQKELDEEKEEKKHLQQEISSITAAKNSLQTELDILLAKNTAREQEFQQILSSHSSSNSEIQQEFLTKLQKERDNVDQMEKEMREMREIIRKEKEQNAAGSAMQITMGEEVESLKKQSSELSTQLHHISDAKSECDKTLLSQGILIKENETKILSSEEEIKSLKSEISLLENQMKSLQNELNLSKSLLDETKSSLLSTENTLQQEREQGGNANSALLSAQNSLREMKLKTDEITAEVEKQREENHKIISDLQRKLEENRAEMSEMKTKFDLEKQNLVDQMTTQQNEMRDLHSSHQEKISSLVESEKKSLSAAEEIQRMEKESESLREKQNDEKKSLTDSFQSQISDLTSSLSTLQGINANLQRENTQIQKEKEEKVNEILTQKAQYAEMTIAGQENISQLLSQINSLNDTIEALKAEVKDKEDDGTEEMHTPTFDAPEVLLSPFDSFVLGHIHNLLTQQWAVATSVLQSTPEGAPGKWIPDNDLTHCAMCHVQYSLMVRRHHCRVCGTMACSRCTSHKIEVPKFKLSDARVCNSCFLVVHTVKLASDAVTSGTINLDEQQTIYSITNKHYHNTNNTQEGGNLQLQHAVSALQKARGSILFQQQQGALMASASSSQIEGKSSSSSPSSSSSTDIPLGGIIPPTPSSSSSSHSHRTHSQTVSLDRTLTFSDIGTFMSTTDGGKIQATQIPFGPVGSVSRNSINQSTGTGSGTGSVNGNPYGGRKSTLSAVAAAKRGSVNVNANMNLNGNK